MTAWRDRFLAVLGDVPHELDAPASACTTWRVGGPLAVLVHPQDPAELARVSEACATAAPPAVLVIGKGSNLLVADAGFDGVAVTLDAGFDTITDTVLDDGTMAVRAGGGLALPVLARRSAAAGRGGLEFYVGIPGTVGGAVRMNAGGHGCDTAAVCVGATILRLGATSEWRPADALAFGYRSSALDARDVVIDATFRVRPDDPETCAATLDEIVRWRRDHQPGGANAGSVFANPPGDSAGRLIEAAGLKGLRRGGAHVSEKHANFIQADAGATAADVAGLIADVRERVRATAGVALRPEVRRIGFAHPDDPGADV